MLQGLDLNNVVGKIGRRQPCKALNDFVDKERDVFERKERMNENDNTRWSNVLLIFKVTVKKKKQTK